MDRDPFEFSQPLCKLTETNVEQARAAYAQFVDAMTQAMDLCLNAMPQNEMTAGLKDCPRAGDQIWEAEHRGGSQPR